MSDHKIHQYQRITRKPSNSIIYRCILPNCSHYIEEWLAWGKITICHNCKEQYVLRKRKNNQAKPKCDNCTGKKKVEVEVEEGIDSLMKDLS